MMPAADGFSTTLHRQLAGRTVPARLGGPFPALAGARHPLDGTARTAGARERMWPRASARSSCSAGTARTASSPSACGDVPICALSTGTNNAFPEMRETTVAGIATGMVATGRAGPTGLRREPVLGSNVPGAARDLALVDVAVSRERFVGARALWRAGDVSELFVTFANPSAVGLSALAGRCPARPRRRQGLHVRLASDAVRPGHRQGRARPRARRPVAVAEHRVLELGEPVRSPRAPARSRSTASARSSAAGRPHHGAVRRRAADDRRRRGDDARRRGRHPRATCADRARREPIEERDHGAVAPPATVGAHQGAVARGLPGDAHHPRVRGARAPRVRDRRDPRASCTSTRARRRSPPACACSSRRRLVASTHRGHGHAIAKGCDVKGDDGRDLRQEDRDLPRQGRLDAHRRLVRGMLGANGIVGGGPPLACGVGLTAGRADRPGRVSFTGDGGSNQGTFLESLNLAAAWHLPVVFVVENNGYAEATSTNFHQAGVRPRQARRRAAVCPASGRRLRLLRRPRGGRRGDRPRAGRRRSDADRVQGVPLLRSFRGRPADLPRPGRGRGAASQTVTACWLRPSRHRAPAQSIRGSWTRSTSRRAR